MDPLCRRAYVEKLMRERKVDGVFLDVSAAVRGTSPNWTTWSQTEKNAWTDGSIDLVRRLDAKRRAINPNFMIVNNNIWSRTGGNTRGSAGREVRRRRGLEHPANGVNAYPPHLRQEGLQQPRSSPGPDHRQERHRSEAVACGQAPRDARFDPDCAQYGYPTAPVVSFKALTTASRVSLDPWTGRRWRHRRPFLFADGRLAGTAAARRPRCSAAR